MLGVMNSNLLTIGFYICFFCCLCDQGLAQCQTGLECYGTIIPGLDTYDKCCGPVLQNNTLARSFSSGSRCSPCYVIGLERASSTLNERVLSYRMRLKVLSPEDPFGFYSGKPRVRLLAVPGTATEIVDFLIDEQDIVLPSFSGLDVFFWIRIDSIAGEPIENFTITSQLPLLNGFNGVKFQFRDSLINIKDSDRPNYEFLIAEYSVFEGTKSTCNKVTIVQTSPLVDTDVHLLVTPMTYAQYTARSATDSSLSSIDTYHGSRPTAATYDPNGKKDFNNTAIKIMFPAGSEKGSIRTVAIEVFDDNIDEHPEGFILVLDLDTSRTTFGVSFTPSRRTALVRINDDDPFYFGFEQQEYTYNEVTDEGIQEIPFSAAPGNVTEKFLSFSLSIKGLHGSFVPIDDFSFGKKKYIMPWIRFEDQILTPFVINDNVVEGTEIGQITILPSQTRAFNGHGSRYQSVRIVITDDDAVTISIAAPSTVSEGSRSFVATVSLSSLTGLTTVLEVDISEIGITATQIADFRRHAPPSVVFDSSTCCNQSVPYLVRDDNIAEPDEILTIQISTSVVSAHIRTVYAVPRVNVTIIDNDVATIGFEDQIIRSAEGSFAVLRIAVLGIIRFRRNVTVRLSTTDISATGGIDYTRQNVDLIFNATAINHEVRIRILRDRVSESAEQFRAILNIVNNGTIRVNLNPSIATVTIPRR